MKMRPRRKRNKPGLVSVGPLRDSFRLLEEVNPWWLWLAGLGGLVLVGLAVLLDLVWELENIIPSVVLALGIGAMLFALLFQLERRIVRRTSIIWVSALEEMAAQTGQDPNGLLSHFAGPVAVVNEFTEAILGHGDYKSAWRVADANWRLCRAQAWLWNNRGEPLVSQFDRESAARDLAEGDSAHPLWESFAQTELDQFTEVWSDPDLRTYGAASATRKVDHGEIVLLVDLEEHPGGAMVNAPTQVNGVPFLVRKTGEQWRVANVVGDHIPEPGWPPDWKEGWTYWDRFLRGDG